MAAVERPRPVVDLEGPQLQLVVGALLREPQEAAPDTDALVRGSSSTAAFLLLID